MPRFLDFHLMVNKVLGRDEDQFIIAVAECPALRFGELFGQFTLRRSETGFWQCHEVSLPLERDVENRFQVARNLASGRSLSYEDIGVALFRLLFPSNSDSLDLLGRSCELLGQGDYLRLKLELHHHLSNLPWELLECPWNEKWAAQINHANLSIIRYLGNTPGAGLAATGLERPSIVIVKADPAECAQGDVTESLGRELANLRAGLDRMKRRVQYEVVEQGATLTGLVHHVHRLRSSPVIGLHFMGHGGVDQRGGYFAGEDESGKLRPIYARDLRNVLIEAPSIRWIILNSCWTGHNPLDYPLAGLATSMAMLKDIPTVIAYQRPVDTIDAEILAADFYEQVLGEGRAIEEVIRSVKSRSSKPEGLVVLARAVEGRIQDVIRVGSPNGGRKVREHEPGDARGLNLSQRRAPARHKPAPTLAFDDGMVVVPAGPFTKGLTAQQVDLVLRQLKQRKVSIDLHSSRNALSGEPQDTVDLPAFRIDRTPVTNAQFRQFTEATQYRTDAERADDSRNWRLHEKREALSHPVVYVSYNDAEAYCRWAGKRLPTENQWKKAYRGSEGRIYPWGDSFDPERCNSAESCRDYETTPVDMFIDGAGPYGCLDMIGNVEEWTATSHGEGKKIILGGSWAMICQVYGLPVLQRLALPSFYSKDLGFRCVDEMMVPHKDLKVNLAQQGQKEE